MKKLNIVFVVLILSFTYCFSINSKCFELTNTDLKINTEFTFQLGSPFKDHMILQRDMPVPVWGKANPDALIILEFANQKKETITNKDGIWHIELNPLVASFESRTMTISCSSEKEPFYILDVLVGEVWICSGQSNMQFKVDAVPEIKSLIPSAKNIRSFAVKNTVAFQPQDTCGGEWVDVHPNSAVAFSFAYFLEKSANVPVGIILTSWGSSSIEAWMPRDMTETIPHFKTMMDEFDADEETKNRIQSILEGAKPWSRQDDIFLRRQSNIVYNAMMHPLIPYACRGLVWYQGERNTQSIFGMLKEPWFSRNSGMLKYGDALQQWILRYRKAWNKNDMHFMVVMLPGYGGVLDSGTDMNPESPAAHSWAWMRESQLKALELPNTSVVNTIDLGDVKNVHPKDKLPIGKRLALLVLRDVLNEDVSAHGPIIKKVNVKKNTMVVHYKNVKQLKTTDGNTPTGFWLADDSKKWFPANGKIKGKTVILHSNKLSKPKYIRYAFAGKPEVNLVNEVNLPAYPFRTDTFKP